MNLERTSNEAASAAAEVCARSSEGARSWACCYRRRHHVVHRVMQFVRTALDALKVIPKRARNGFVRWRWILVPYRFRGAFAHNSPSLHSEARCFGVNGLAVPVCQLLLNKQERHTGTGCQPRGSSRLERDFLLGTDASRRGC